MGESVRSGQPANPHRRAPQQRRHLTCRQPLVAGRVSPLRHSPRPRSSLLRPSSSLRPTATPNSQHIRTRQRPPVSLTRTCYWQRTALDEPIDAMLRQPHQARRLHSREVGVANGHVVGLPPIARRETVRLAPVYTRTERRMLSPRQRAHKRAYVQIST